MQELQAILNNIAARHLAIQWDTAVELGVLESVFPSFFANPFAAICERLIRLGNAVPAEVELGYHLCYGDSGHKHFVEPKDTEWLTRVANTLYTDLNRDLDWLHLPDPKNRVDTDYFQPLQHLKRPSDSQLYLGLLHAGDGETGAQQRIQAARSVVADFGVATECGFGRRAVDSLEPLMTLHNQIGHFLAQ